MFHSNSFIKNEYFRYGWMIGMVMSKRVEEYHVQLDEQVGGGRDIMYKMRVLGPG